MLSTEKYFSQSLRSVCFFTFLLLISFFFVSCSSQKIKKIVLAPAKLLLPHEYQRTVTQGRVLKKEKVDLIHIGSSKTDVLLFLGKPIIQDVFDPNKWIYLYKKQSELHGLIKYRVEIEFVADKVSNLVRKGI